MKILLIEDDEAIISLLTKSLTAHRYVVDAVRDGEMGWVYGSTFEYDLIVMDIMLPKLDGMTLCQRFRAEEYTIPIVLLTAQDSSTAKIQGLNAGADDYVIKPFDVEELIARIRALLRRCSANPSPLMSWGALLLDPVTCEVTYSGQPLNLTTKEYELIELLLQDSRHVMSNEEILDRLWSSDEFPAEATVRSHIRRLRYKLQEAGAPHDFIGTLYGRGYYLKPVDQPTAQLPQPAPDTVPSLATPDAGRDSSQTVQYAAFLNETWLTTQPHCLAQVEILSQAVQTLQSGLLTEQIQQQAHHIAHKLVGTLGIFGLTQGEHLARRLEDLLSAELIQQKQVIALENLVLLLQQEIQSTPTLQRQSAAAQTPIAMLIIDADAGFTQALAEIASQRGIKSAIAPTLEVAYQSLVSSTPDVIVLRLSDMAQRRECLQTLADYLPKIPILTVANQDSLSQRLEVSRWGGTFLLEQSVTLEQIVTDAVRLVQHPTADAKVMFVDDDDLWLRSLPALLEPWRFKVTTLSDPQQFWNVLQSVSPDALVLDIKMPEIDGLELCQVLRSDPQWQQLPVLFVSALEDAKTQKKAFIVGADDYLCKPVMGDDLASRILNRLRRIKSCTR
jgi:DNA-binding response OmpR family regulator